MLNFDSKIFREKYVKFVIGQTYFLAGCSYAFSALLIPKLPNDPVLSEGTIAWIAASGILMRAFVGGLSVYLTDSIGRQSTIRLKTFIIMIGWIITTTSSNVIIFCIGRVITSIGLGFTIDNIEYISETCTKHHTSNLVSLTASFTTAGIVFSNLLQYYFSWRTSAFLIAIVSSMILLQTHIIPETRYWYMMKSRRREAIMASLWFEKKKTVQNIQEELNVIERIQLSKQDINFFKTICNPSLMKPLCIYIFIVATRIGSGYLIFVHYAATFFEELNIKYNPANLTLFMAVFNFAFTFLFPTVIKTCKHKNILVTCSIIMVIAIGIANVYQIMFHGGSKSFSWVPVTCLFAYMTINVAFFEPIITIMLSEIFSKFTRQHLFILHNAIEYKLSTGYIFGFPKAAATYGIESLLWFFLANVSLCFMVTLYFSSNSKNPIQIESVTFFGNNINSRKIDQQELLRSMIDEENSS